MFESCERAYNNMLKNIIGTKSLISINKGNTTKKGSDKGAYFKGKE